MKIFSSKLTAGSSNAPGNHISGLTGDALNQGCLIMSIIVIREAGSTTSILVIKSFASKLRKSGIRKIPDLTLDRSLRIFSSSKGKFPVKSANKITPHDQMSAGAPSYLSPLIISGEA